MNGLLPILRSMDTQVITYPYSFLQLFGVGTNSTRNPFSFLEYLYDKLFRHLEWNPFLTKNSSGGDISVYTEVDLFLIDNSLKRGDINLSQPHKVPGDVLFIKVRRFIPI